MENWLAENRFSSLIPVFTDRNITEEELCEFDPTELKEVFFLFAERDLELDKETVVKFVRAVEELKRERKEARQWIEKRGDVPKGHLLSPQEQSLIKKLDEELQQANELIGSIRTKLEQWENEMKDEKSAENDSFCCFFFF
ncbi:hypothetical protein RFI_11017, partial [Reticulomyxa filosa]